MVTTSTESVAYERSHYNVLRLFGAIIVGAGVILTTVGSFSLFSSWATTGGSRYYWAAFLGLPLIAVGSAFTQAENLSASDEDLFDHRTKLERDEPAARGSRHLSTLPRDQPEALRVSAINAESRSSRRYV